MQFHNHDIIVAPATLSGGAISVIRVSGEGSILLTDKIFRGKRGEKLAAGRGHTIHYGDIVDEKGEIVDDVLVSLFRAPHSYTSEDGVEISCHGSQYIVQRIISLVVAQGARMAEAGEFTLRAYMAGRMDLSQAEAVADVIASNSEASLRIASTQMRGGYSSKLAELRASLLKLVTLLELELDFSEEDVEFADRTKLRELITEIEGEVTNLANSFAIGNAIKKGVAVAIIGEPNAGKSTLLNRILNDDRAMVSEIAGTTRDVIEESVVIKGITFRFIDTAGIHATTDKLEQMGIERSLRAKESAQIVIHLIDATQRDFKPLQISREQRLIIVRNKIDLTGITGAEQLLLEANSTYDSTINISAKAGIGIETLLDRLYDTLDTEALYSGDPIVSSARHYAHLEHAKQTLHAATAALRDNIPTDLLCEEIRQTLHHIGAITGDISTDEILGNIFSNFCIGK